MEEYNYEGIKVYRYDGATTYDRKTFILEDQIQS